MNEITTVSAEKKFGTKGGKTVSQVRKSYSSQLIASSVDHILNLQRIIGNNLVGRFLKSGMLQNKLRVGHPGDKYEQEADRVAEQVMRMPEPQKVSKDNFHIRRACTKCEENDEATAN